ncbi:N-acetylglutaminylglutamine synthetase [Miltoncostaea marina]|uniref:N-acetylglutaminylglutamine synthetase n=1 Tax=Miltoncostaea marina TaxID=2843215 RepID=UPI001C3D97EE|nr:N-acetylglutaminylglutamine synthetase [Miltoncostaea marina]
MSEEQRPRTERVGPGGDPYPPAQGAPEGGGGDGRLEEVTLDCGWGRLVFGNTFRDPSDAADVLRSEADGARDICVYLDDPHVLVARRHDELFIDPSHTYRLALPAGLGGRLASLEVRELRDEADADAVNRMYTANGMITAPVEVLVANSGRPEFLHLVAEHVPTGAVVGTITGVDHVAVFGDPEGGTSLWCLTVDMNAAPPGTGQALLTELAERFAARGRRFVDLSVLADNAGAIRLYERLGFERIPSLFVKRKNPINEDLFVGPKVHGLDVLNPYARIIADEARRRGVAVEVIDAEWGEMRLTHGGRRHVMRESLSDLTTAIAMSRCDDKRITRRVLADAGLRVPRGVTAGGGEEDEVFLREVGRLVVKPARGEQGAGITVGVETPRALRVAVEAARRHCPDVLLEEYCEGMDLRVIVIDKQVVAAAVRRPATIVGDGRKDIRALIEAQSRRRQAATGGESRIPLDAATEEVVRAAGHSLTDVLPAGEALEVRRTANLHTGGTIHDVTAELHPDIAAACVAASEAIDIPVTGLDLLVPDPSGSEHVFIEANERPGLANHEPQPTVERYLDLLFPGTRGVPRRWVPAEAQGDGGEEP